MYKLCNYAIIFIWHQQSMNTACVLSLHSSGKSGASVENTEIIPLPFYYNSKSSVCSFSHQLYIPKSTVHDVVYKRLKLKTSKR